MADHAQTLPSLKGQPWLMDPVLQELLTALGTDKARIVGGAVRNALLGEPVEDVDIATVWPPHETMKWAAAAGFSVHPVAVEHGSVIVSRRGRAFEVTTLRRDVETDGRHARVAFTADWEADARRRDFTMNALYADASGALYDPVGGYGDLLARRVRFIGEAQERIREDYLRILRFFRFWARYAKEPPEEEALAACAARREGLARISRERIQAEMQKLLPAPRALEALLFMGDAGVLDFILPGCCARDFTAFMTMAKDDAARGLKADWLLRLAALCGPCAELKDAFRLSRAQAGRLEILARAARGEVEDWRLFFYDYGGQAAQAAIRLLHARGDMDETAFDVYLETARGWTRPDFPLRGKDLIAAGIAPGPRLGQILEETRRRWILDGFAPRKREELLQEALRRAGEA